MWRARVVAVKEGSGAGVWGVVAAMILRGGGGAAALFAVPEGLAESERAEDDTLDLPLDGMDSDGETSAGATDAASEVNSEARDASATLDLMEVGPDAPQPRGGHVDAESARAFGVLYERELSYLMGLAASVLGAYDAAEDIVQATALRCLPHWPRVRSQSLSLGGTLERAAYFERCYLVRAVKNVACEQRRRVTGARDARDAFWRADSLDASASASGSGADVPESESADWKLPTAARDDPAEIVLRAEAWDEVLALCTARQRAILEYRRLGYEIEEIAALLAGVPGISGSAGALRNDLYKLGQRLRARVAALGHV